MCRLLSVLEKPPAEFLPPWGAESWKRHMLNRWRTFLREVRAELNKVTWPKRKEVQGTTVVVLITCVIFGVYLWFVDIVMSRALTWLYAALG